MAEKTERTTITVDKKILNAAKEKAKCNEENLSSFIARAILNQLEKENVYNIRYEMGNENENF